MWRTNLMILKKSIYFIGIVTMLFAFTLSNCGKGKNDKTNNQTDKAQTDAKAGQPDAKAGQADAKAASGDITADKIVEFYEKMAKLVKEGKGQDQKAMESLAKEYGFNNPKESQANISKIMMDLQKSDPNKFKEISTRIQNATKVIMEEAMKQMPKK